MNRILFIAFLYCLDINNAWSQSDFIENDSIIFQMDTAFINKNHKRLHLEINVINSGETDFFLLKPQKQFFCSNYYKVFLISLKDTSIMFEYIPCNSIDNISPGNLDLDCYYKIQNNKSKKIKLSLKIRNFSSYAKYKKFKRDSYQVRFILRNFDPLSLKNNILFRPQYIINQ